MTISLETVSNSLETVFVCLSFGFVDFIHLYKIPFFDAPHYLSKVTPTLIFDAVC